MGSRAITLVLTEAVTRIGGIELFHDSVPYHLGHYGSSRHRYAARVALHDCEGGNAYIGHLSPIDYYAVGLDIQGVYGLLHSKQAGFKDVHPVDCIRRGYSHADGHGQIRDLLESTGPRMGGELFRIVYSRGNLFRSQHHRGRNHRPGQWSPARFIDTGNALEPAFPELCLEADDAAAGRSLTLSLL